LIGTKQCEKICSIVEATTADLWLSICSTKSKCIYFVRVLAIRNIVEAIVNFSVGGEGGEGGEEVIEVCIVGTIACVVTLV
jgi:hypothetical protein